MKQGQWKHLRVKSDNKNLLNPELFMWASKQVGGSPGAHWNPMHGSVDVSLISGDGPLHSLILKMIRVWVSCLKEEWLDAFEHLEGHDYHNFELFPFKVLGNKTCLGK